MLRMFLKNLEVIFQYFWEYFIEIVEEFEFWQKISSNDILKRSKDTFDHVKLLT